MKYIAVLIIGGWTGSLVTVLVLALCRIAGEQPNRRAGHRTGQKGDA